MQATLRRVHALPDGLRSRLRSISDLVSLHTAHFSVLLGTRYAMLGTPEAGKKAKESARIGYTACV